MPVKKAIDWTSVRSYQRLLAAVYAASPQNHNYREIATMFGEGATYDSIEGRFRKIKAEAAILKDEVASGKRSPAPARGNGGGGGGKSSDETMPKAKGKRGRQTKGATDNGTTTNGARDGVISGRVTKTGRAGGGRGGGKGKKGLVSTAYVSNDQNDRDETANGGGGGGDDEHDDNDASYMLEENSPTGEDDADYLRTDEGLLL